MDFLKEGFEKAKEWGGKFLEFINWDFHAVKDYLITLVLTIIITYFVAFLIKTTVHKFFEKTNFFDEKKEQTVESVLVNSLGIIKFFIIVYVAIKPFADIEKLLVAGGVIGIVIGFGAQSLIKDLLNGVFMIFERTIQKGDFVNINGEPEGGTVEEMGFRVVKIRLINGKLLTVPNGEVRKMLNGSVERRRIFEGVIVSFRENPSKIITLLEEICQELNEKHVEYLKKDKDGEFIEQYKVHGLSSLDVTPIGYKYSIAATVNDTDYITAVQETKLLMAQKFYDNNIKMPEQVIHMGEK